MKFIIILCFLFIATIGVSAQSPCVNVNMPAGTLCITQADANTAAANTRERDALKSEVELLKGQLIEKDKIREGVEATARKNDADLRATLHDTEVKLGTATGQIVECRADKTMYTALIEYLTKNQRSKQQGLINIKLGGN